MVPPTGAVLCNWCSNALDLSLLKVSCASEQVGKGFTVVVVVVVKKDFWRVNQSLCFSLYAFPRVEGTSVSWDCMTQKN